MIKKVFWLICTAQIIFLLYTVFSNQIVLETGKQFKFITAPVDPYDVFRGHYIILRFAEERQKPAKGKVFNCHKNKYTYVIITKDEKGFAKVESVSGLKPKKQNYFKAEIIHCEDSNLQLSFPFNKFFMQDKMASEAEKQYFKYNRNNNNSTYALVKIKNGKAVLEDLYINHKSVKQSTLLSKSTN